MAKCRFIITQGGSDEVVKLEHDVMVGHGRMNGRKRFLQDKTWRHGGADNFMSGNKRQRGDGADWRCGGGRGQGSRIAGNDLRFKLISKRRPHQFRNAFEKCRKRNSGKLSKDIRPPQNLSKHPCRRGPNKINNLSRISHNGITDGLHLYSLPTMDGSRGFPEIPQIMPTALARTDLFSSNGDFNPSRESGLVPITEKAITSRPVTYVAPVSGIMPRKTHVDEEPFIVANLLNSLGLGKYVFHFMAEEVDMTALRQMRDRDFKELGIPMGPRKKLLLALKPPSLRHRSRIMRL